MLNNNSIDVKTIAGILLLPVLAVALWYVFGSETSPAPPEVQAGVGAQPTFEHDGNLIRNNPGLVPDVWYLSYETPGSPGRFVQLEFDGESRCGSEALLKICDISFDQGQRVRIEGFQNADSVRVTKLIYGSN